MNKQLTVLSAIALAGVLSAEAQSVLYNWQYSGDTTAAGTLTVDSTSDLGLDVNAPLNGVFGSIGYDYTIRSFTQTTGDLNFTALYPSPADNPCAINFLTATAPTSNSQINSQFRSAHIYLSYNGGENTIYFADLQGNNSTQVMHIDGEYATFNNSFVLSMATVPEPSTIALTGLGLAALLAARRRK